MAILQSFVCRRGRAGGGLQISVSLFDYSQGTPKVTGTRDSRGMTSVGACGSNP